MRLKGRRRLACYHEAGHALARWWLGFSTDNVVVLSVEQVLARAGILDRRGCLRFGCEGLVNGYEIIVFGERKDLAEGYDDERRAWLVRQCEARAEMEIMSCYIGPYAEARFTKCGALGCFLGGGEGDLADVQRIIEAWFDGDPDKTVRVRADGIARSLVRSEKGWKAITVMAEALHRKGEIDGDEIDAICSEAYGQPLEYGAWLNSWPPTPKQIRDGYIPVRPPQMQAA